MLENIEAAYFLHAGAVAYVLAFLFRDEAILRGLSVLGTGLYMVYYFAQQPEPLWDPIITSAFFVGANVVVMFMIMLERTTFSLSEEEKRLYEGFPTFTPGQFRRMLKLAQWHTATQDSVLTRQGDPLDRLYYVLDGTVSIERDGHSFPMTRGNFVGEIAYVLDGMPTGTVTAPAGTRYVEWQVKAIERLARRKPVIGNAMVALLSADLARKLGASSQLVAGEAAA